MNNITNGKKKTNKNQKGIGTVGIIIIILLAGMVALHLLWPVVLLLKYAANTMVLLAGSIWLSYRSAKWKSPAGDSLPFGHIGIVLAAGTVLFAIFGWKATIAVLIVYGGFCFGTVAMKKG